MRRSLAFLIALAAAPAFATSPQFGPIRLEVTQNIVHATAATGTDAGSALISKNAWNAAHTAPAILVNEIPAGLIWPGPGASLAEFCESTNYRWRANLTNAATARLVATVVTAGGTGSVLRAQYTTDLTGATGWAYLDGATGPSVAIDATGTAVSTSVTLATTAKADVLLRLVGLNGDGAGGSVCTVAQTAALATALAANGANCSTGSFPLGVDASGASESCTALPTTIAGTTNQITASASTGAITLSIPTNPTLPGTTSGTFSGALAGNASTATALATNGANCSAGSAPIGVDASGAAESCTAYQPSDADLTTIAGLTATTDTFIQSKSSAWTTRTPTQVTADLDAVVGDSGSGGTKGLVPAPAAGDAAANKYLKASGAWATVAGGIAVGGAITSGTANRLLYEDASNLLGESSSLAVDMSGAGDGTFTFRKTPSGSSTTSNFLTATGTLPTTLSAKARGWSFNMVGDNDAQIQEALYVEHSGTATTEATYGISVSNSHRSANAAAFGVYATGDSTSALVGVYGNAGGGGSLGIGVMGNGNGAATGYTNSYGVFGSPGNGTTSFGIMASRSRYDVARPIDGSGDDAAFGATNNSDAVSIARFYDNSTLVFDIGDGGNLAVYRTVTAGGTTGAQTINKPAGTVNFAAAATSIVVTNSLVTTSSIIFTTMRTADTTCTFVKSVVPASGSFTITVNAGCNAETSVGFLVTN